ncbi:AspT family membrane protein, TrkA-C domain pair-containing [Geotalea daltonii FRC-32]|uniref:AspT family membrane protein, TrkA-C domain pair-containing n=1 Tax=Geotalea daltonii (strain DSM 22248 / JCM 15807 / FRC-32) TaxID=316067 RepID=B9M3S5_GEODF|nr:aspartate:alanine exchanger family transporter [Geotalea daltonii]ACM19568.1 AspT family membrane protein, TrkA-C domain pair-containing [Geotalea daltonii FRC-32]
MLQVLINNPLLLLFVVAAIGYPLGQLKVHGSCLGVAAVLFVGLAVGSIHPDLKLPEIVYILGLGLFVYTIGLSSGPAFVASLRREGLRNNLLVIGMLFFASGLAVIAHRLLHLKASLTAGMFAGCLTNTPALASALETIKHTAPAQAVELMLAEPVVGYSITYPVGVIGVVLAITIVQRLWHIDYTAEAKRMHTFGASSEPLLNCTISVTHAHISATIDQLSREQKWDVLFGRIKRRNHVFLSTPQTVLEPGDMVIAVGTEEELHRVAVFLGEQSSEHIGLDRSEYDYRRIFVSNTHVAGRAIGELKLQEKFGAVITRVRRGDVDFLPHEDMVLELGDRVRVLTRTREIGRVTSYFGDSYRAVSEVDIMTFSLGLALGLLLGTIPLPLPGGITIKLGFAGGPLIVALILGTVGRTGSMVWSLPYGANMTLRQIGLVFFLAGVGTRAGYSFFSTFSQGGGLTIFAAGAAITCLTALATLWVGHRLLKIPFSLLIGMVAGLQTQPAVLGYALEQTGNDLPNIGYASVYPVATIGKIVAVQLLLVLLM